MNLISFSQAVYSLRNFLGFTQSRLAEELGVSYATVNRWENGWTMPNTMALNMIHQYCANRNIEFTYNTPSGNSEDELEVEIMKLTDELLSLIKGGENQKVEFKRSATDIPSSVYESVCAFSNREGGYMFLGVKDNGEITGVNPNYLVDMKKDFVTAINNRNKMNPPLYIKPVEYEYGGKIILVIQVPRSQNVSRCSGRIFDRNYDSDIDITDNENLVYQLYARKQDTYYVNKVYPRLSLEDLRSDLIERARKMATTRVYDHPWLRMSDEEMLRSTGLILRNPETGDDGITLAAILLFGSDNVIISVLAHHKTDALFRVFHTDRYDDRNVIITNLIDSFDRLIAFGEKHLNDIFVMEGMQSVSARDKILREIISNFLAHRDYSSAYVAKFVIEKDRMYTENSNRAHGIGLLDISSFEPYPKNPPISKVFREIGLADELGSGMRNTYKYTKLYSGGTPSFQEGDIFRTTIPLSEAATTKVGGIAGDTHEYQVRDSGETSRQKVLSLLRENPSLSQKELSEYVGISVATLKRILSRLVESGLIERKNGKRYGYWLVKD